MPPFLARDHEKGVNPTMVDTTMRARPRGRHKKGFFARLGAKATSMLSVGAILGAGMVGMVSTASADDESRTITPMAAPGWSDNAGHYMGSGEGYFVGNFNGPGGTTWLCAADPTSERPSHWQVTSANYGDARPTDTLNVARKTQGSGGTGYDRERSVSGARVHRAGYIASEFGRTNSNSEAAAAELAIIMATGMYDGSYYDNSNGFNPGTRPLPNSVRDRAEEMLDEAERLAGPYSANRPSIGLDADRRGGQVTIHPVRSAAGNALPGVSFTATVSGPATFDNGDRSISGTISGDVVRRSLVSTGNGNVRVEVTYNGLPARAHVARGTVNGRDGQDILQAGLTERLVVDGDPVQMVLGFQPEVTTEVDSQLISAGDSFVDNVTAAAAEGETWMIANGAYVPVKATGVLYGPYTERQPRSDTVPAGAPVAGTAELIFNGPGTLQAGEDIIAEGSGYYAWVWTIDPDDQPAGSGQYITDSFSDGFFEVSETTMVRMDPQVTTQVDDKYISTGDAFVDNVTADVRAGVWLTVDGEPVEVKAEGVLYGPYAAPQAPADEAPADAPVAGTAELTFDGPGTLQAGHDIVADTSGYYSWVWSIDKENQSEAAREYINSDFSDGFFTATETSVVRMTPSIATERDEEFILPGDGLVDHVTLSLADGQMWLDSEDGGPAEIVAVGTAYGPFDRPMAQQDDVPADAPVAGTETLVFTEEGTQATTGSVIAEREGFYTWVWEIEQTDYNDAYVTPFFEEIETSSARYELTITSETREYNVVPGGLAFDTITVSGFPEFHGDWQGLGGWEADGQVVTHTLYGPFAEAPTSDTDLDTAPVVAAVDTPAENGTYRIGYGEHDDERAFHLTEAGHYVFVSHYAGDSIIAPLTTDPGDLQEQVYVPGETESKPSVTTRAVPKAPVGSPFNDEALVTGNVKEGSELTFDLYGPFERGEDGKCVAPASLEDAGEPVFTSGPHPVDGPGVYASDAFTAEDEGCYFWVETLYGPDGEVEHQGEIGAPGETTEVYTPEREVTVHTQLQHDGEGNRPVVGDSIWDEVVVEGEVAEGDYVVVDLFTWEEGEAPTCDEPVWTSDPIMLDGEGVYTTGKYVTLTAAVHGFRETTYSAEGEILSQGLCGEPEETVTVTDGGGGDGGSGAGDGGAGAGGGSLENTGAPVLAAAGLAVLLALAGAGAVIGRRQGWFGA